MSDQQSNDVLDAVLATFASQNRDLRTVSLEEAKAVTYQIIARREMLKQQCSTRTLQN